jgi:hypothetical protein
VPAGVVLAPRASGRYASGDRNAFTNLREVDHTRDGQVTVEAAHSTWFAYVDNIINVELDKKS